MKCTKNKVRMMFKKMDPKHKLYLLELQQKPEEGFKKQFLVELQAIGKKLTPTIIEKIYNHYQTILKTGTSVYYGMSSKQVNPNSEDFIVIEFLSTIEFWAGFFEIKNEDSPSNDQQVLDILDGINKKTQH